MKKQLIIRQHDLTDCGPACLLSVIIYYGGFVPIESLRTNAFTDKNGTSAYNLINCAKKYGFTATGIKTESIKKISKDKLPCIAHVTLKNGLNHYIVIYEINKGELEIMDPGQGKVKMSTDKFNEIFSGVIILLHPYTKIEKLNKPKSITQIIINSILKNKLTTVFLFLFSLLVIIASIFVSYFIKIGKFIIGKSIGINALYYVFILFFILYIIKNIFDYIKNKLIIRFNKNVALKLYNDFSKTIFSLPLSFIRSRTSGEIICRYSELSNVVNLLPGIILSIFLDLVTSLITLYFSLIISYRLTIIVVIFMIIYFFIAYAFKNPTLHKISKNLDENVNFNSIIIETVNNLRSIKNLNNEDIMREKVNRYCSNTLDDNYKLDNFYNKVNFIKNLFYDLMIFSISSYGLYLIYFNKFNVVDLFTFLMVMTYFTEPIKDLVDMITKYCYIKTSVGKLSDFSIIKEEDRSNIIFKPGDIIVSNLSYAYNGIDYVIKNYSCFIKNKSKILVQGNSGSGKSTLCQILSKQLTNYDGNIYISNNNLSQIKSDSLRKNVTYIGQKDSLIVDTIENNIKYERNVDNKEFNTICRICEIDKIVNNKFNKYSSLISESSDNISGGEKQRITLARGLLNSGEILILDESLSEVNKDMEERIIRRIIKYFYNKTIIYVSHKNYKNIFDKVVKI